MRVFWVLHAGKHQLLAPRQHADEDMDDVCDEDDQRRWTKTGRHWSSAGTESSRAGQPPLGWHECARAVAPPGIIRGQGACIAGHGYSTSKEWGNCLGLDMGAKKREVRLLPRNRPPSFWSPFLL